MAKELPTIHFQTKIIEINSQLIARIPEEQSELLPSRGQVSVVGEINSVPFATVLEPDGYWMHFIKFTPDQQKALSLQVGTELQATLTPSPVWPEPTIPTDIKKALNTAPEKVQNKWKDISPMARWEWIRWINETANPVTREVRIEKTISKLNGKHRRPCCFNLAACTDSSLSKSGRLMGIN